MSAIASTFRRFWVEIAWGLFAAANVAVIFLVGRWETIPFHLVWVSLALVYGSRLWSPRTTVIEYWTRCAVITTPNATSLGYPRKVSAATPASS